MQRDAYPPGPPASTTVFLQICWHTSVALAAKQLEWSFLNDGQCSQLYSIHKLCSVAARVRPEQHPPLVTHWPGISLQKGISVMSQDCCPSRGSLSGQHLQPGSSSEGQSLSK